MAAVVSSNRLGVDVSVGVRGPFGVAPALRDSGLGATEIAAQQGEIDEP